MLPVVFPIPNNKGFIFCFSEDHNYHLITFLYRSMPTKKYKTRIPSGQVIILQSRSNGIDTCNNKIFR